MKIELSLLSFSFFWLRLIILALFFLVGSTAASVTPSDPEPYWHTFMGSSSSDKGLGLAIEGNGSVYVVGESRDVWGQPVDYAGDNEAFVAKFSSGGDLDWNTFLGSSSSDSGRGVAVDNSGNVYVTGDSYFTWGFPVNDHMDDWDAFVAKLNSSNGHVSWNTFLGSSSVDYGRGIAVDENGNVYITGYSSASWGNPVNSHTGNWDAFVAKLDNEGHLSWNTFLGSSSDDYGRGVAVDKNGNMYVTGYSSDSWGNPVSSHRGNWDVFVAKLDQSSGSLSWNTFLGSSSDDSGFSLAVYDDDAVYVTGYSGDSWGNPVTAHTGNTDAFVAKLNHEGRLSWNTFMGSSAGNDYGFGVAVSESGAVYVMGDSTTTWGDPVDKHAGNYDVFVAQLFSNGHLRWSTFLGSLGPDLSRGRNVAVANNGAVYVTGYSGDTWGHPANGHAGNLDAFLVVMGSDYGADGCKHAIYSLDDKTLAIPAVEVPVWSMIDKEFTGETLLLTGTLKQDEVESTRFSILSLVEISSAVMEMVSTCPASYSVESEILSLPRVEIPVVVQLGNQQSKVDVEVFEVIMRWRSDLDLFVVDEIQRVE